ncbi:MAG: OmpP1/FadL family transporter [Hyphomicrobiaceae bacterium]
MRATDTAHFRFRGSNGIQLSFVVALSMAVLGSTGEAMAGSFAIREQSVSSQGASFAGSAAGGDLSSIFWNPAAAGVKSGLNTESHYSLIIPRANIDVTSVENTIAPIENAFQFFNAKSGNIGDLALVGASYANYQLNRNLWLGFGLNSPFGLSTKPGDANYQGAVLGRTNKLLTLNANPTIAYQVMPGVLIGAGLQVQWGDATLRFASGLPNGPSTSFEGDGWAFGGTAGILLQPNAATSIGLGYRSRLTQNLEGQFDTNARGFNINAEADLELPDIVTFSIRQAVTSNTRLLGTVEWSNWSRFKDLEVIATSPGASILTGPIASGTQIANIPANWDDGWFFSLGAEYDVSPSVTVRGGVAYEISPMGSPEQRIVTIPDSDRVWLSAGTTMKVSESMELDLAYTHVFLEDGEFSRETVATSTGLPPPTTVAGTTKARTDILSLSLKSKW